MRTPLIDLSVRHALLFAIFLVLYEFLTYIANDMIMPGMIDVVSSFHASMSNVANSVTVYVLGGASLQLFLGPLSDAIGRRPVMLWGAFLFCLMTWCVACSFSMNTFLLARFFQGMGLCFISVVGYAVFHEIFAERDVIKLFAIMGNVAILAPLLGPLLGAFLLLYVDWRWIFIFLGLLAFVAWWGLWRYMPESVGQKKRDGSIIVPMTWSVQQILSSYGRLLSHRPFVCGVLAYSFIGVPCMTWIALSPVIVVVEEHYSMLHYALWQLPVFGAYILGNFMLSYWSQKKTLKELILIGSVVIVLSLVLMVVLSRVFPASFVYFMPGLMGYFWGYSFVSTPLNRMILFATPVTKGTASALLCVVSMLTQALGIEGINLIYTSHRYVLFSLYSAMMGLGFVLMLVGVFYVTTQKK